MEGPYHIATWKLGSLYKQITEGEISVPGFQRSVVWSDKQKKEFIDSLKSGYPFGSLLLFKEEGNPYILIDGLQRSNTIREYFSKPTEFFAASAVSKKLSDLLTQELPQKDNPWESDEIHGYIEKWVKSLNINSLDQFLPSQGFKSEELLQYLISESVVEIEREKERALAKLIDPLLEELHAEADISNSDVPVIIYTRGKEKLPEVFQRLNRGGTQLNKYQIYAAAWSHIKVPVRNLEIKVAIKARFEAYIDRGFTVQDYDSETFDQETQFSPFEYLYGLGKVLSKNTKLLFSSKEADEEVDSFGFNLSTYALNLDVPQMGILLEKLPEIDLEIFHRDLLESAKQIEASIRPFVAVHANRKKGLNRQEEQPIYHSEFQIVSLIAKYYRMKFVENRADHDIEKFLKNVPYHYLYDIIDDYWRGSGNSKAYVLIQPGSRYEYPIDKKRWDSALENWFENQLLSRKEKDRASIKLPDVLFLKYIYAFILTRHEDLSDNTIFEVEHLVPVNRLKFLAQKRGIGLPISCVANLSLLPKAANRLKSDKTIYEYFDSNSDMLEELESRFTFTKREDFESLEALTQVNYTAFLKNRFKTLKDKFYESNNI